MNKHSRGILSGEDKSAGFTSLLVVAGLSVAAGSMLYSATARNRNMGNMLQNDRVRNSRDAIANALRNSVTIPSVLRLSATLDSTSDLAGCIDSSNATPCDAVDGSGNPVLHPLKVFDTRNQQLSGTPAHGLVPAAPVYYDPQTGSLCDPLNLGPNCAIQATTWFTIDCGSDTNCKGKPAATLKIGFIVEQKPGSDLPNKVALRPIESVPSLLVPLSAIMTSVSQISASPGDPNKPYTPIVDPTTGVDIMVFDPDLVTGGSKLCKSMKALGNPVIPYDALLPASGSPAVQYTNMNQDLRASNENISLISTINGDTWVTANTITLATNFNATINPGQAVSLNAINIGSVANVVSPHSYIVAHSLGDVSNVDGYLYVNADSIGQFSNVTTDNNFTAVYRGWIQSGATAPTASSFSNIMAGNFMLCGFNVTDLSNVNASFVGLQNASVLNNSSNFVINQLKVYGGTIANITNFTGNMTLYKTTVGDIDNLHGHIEAHGGTINKITNPNTSTIDLYDGATVTDSSGVPAGQIIYH
jgi:hypothetical protein